MNFVIDAIILIIFVLILWIVLMRDKPDEKTDGGAGTKEKVSVLLCVVLPFTMEILLAELVLGPYATVKPGNSPT